MILSISSIALELHADLAADSPYSRALERDLPRRLARLSPWGRFCRPVKLLLVDNSIELKLLAPRASLLDLRGLAWNDAVWLLRPERWPAPPDPGEWVTLVLHELAHILWFQRSTSPERAPAYAPTWFREGLAVVAAEGLPPATGRRYLADDAVESAAYSDDAGIADLGGVVYAVAAQLFAAWWQQHGTRPYASLCRELRAGRGFSAAFLLACEVDDRAFVAAEAARWRAEARTQ
jgi:hypothetical protein